MGASVSIIKVISCYALLRMLLVCIHSFLRSVIRNKFLTLDTYHPDTNIYVSKAVVTFRNEKGSASKKKSLGNTVKTVIILR
jgi:hypothetical protein